jgi:Mg2+-importing ATPase
MPEAGFGPGSAEAAPFALTTGLVTLAQQDESQLLATLESHADGLSPHEAEERLATLGPNEVDHEKPLPWWRHLWQCYRNPFNLLLTVLAAVSWLTEDIKATIVIGAMVLLSTLIRFVQEGRSNRAAERLKALVGNTARVLRRNPGTEAADVADQYFGAHLHSRRPARLLDLPIRELVPGDHIVLSAGDMIPADCRVLTAKDLFVARPR